jgi:phospholipase/carboxylesterase
MDPHAGQPVLTAGASPESAEAAMIMIHGRGAGAHDIIGLAEPLARPRFLCLAPDAAGATWYPYSFMAPREQNEPWLGSALNVIESLVIDQLDRGLPAHKIVLLGFSQGACLSSEFMLRHPRRYGGLIAFSGGLIGPAGTTWADVVASFAGVPVFLGCSDIDPHIPKERVIETAGVFERLGASVTRKLYPRMGHTINDDEITEAQKILDQVLATKV